MHYLTLASNGVWCVAHRMSACPLFQRARRGYFVAEGYISPLSFMLCERAQKQLTKIMTLGQAGRHLVLLKPFTSICIRLFLLYTKNSKQRRLNITQIALQCKVQDLYKWFLNWRKAILNSIIWLCQYAVNTLMYLLQKEQVILFQMCVSWRFWSYYS